ncbi:hypothetical protein BDP81DRAFT_79742 [Colletotrichum phormii]|uniref:Uncharacterized protein n=1 Tax=Colletotrichum phormii TaxID=359342 RepID=A0AAJ0A0K1_9PEZI|nr:uncharacterized protein BDP81DRAFT_79742 [Colletotrichum phormii]KAK1654230.1 hypothetical protein BDP81DRAFT_79742 [Colletotrichum phormii]
MRLLENSPLCLFLRINNTSPSSSSQSPSSHPSRVRYTLRCAIARHSPPTSWISSISLLSGYFPLRSQPSRSYLPCLELISAAPICVHHQIGSLQLRHCLPVLLNIESDPQIGEFLRQDLCCCFTPTKMASRHSNVLGRLVDNQVEYSFIPRHPIKSGPGLHLSIQSSLPYRLNRPMRHVAFFGATGYTVFRCLMHALQNTSIFCHVYVRCESSL